MAVTTSPAGVGLGTLPRQRAGVQRLTAAPDIGGAELRDRLTRAHLRSAGEAPDPADVVSFRARWWDGAAHVPAVVVRLSDGRRRRRCRVVETGGRVVAVPATGWRARRALRRLRRPAVVEPVLLTLAAEGPCDQPPRVSLLADAADAPPGRPSAPRRRPGPRRVVVIEQLGDAVRCRHHECAALVLVPPPGRLAAPPRCPSGHPA